MKKIHFLTASLIGALMVPVAAQAQPHPRPHEVRKDHRDARKAPQDWRRDSRYQSYRAPFAYQQFRPGSTLRSNYYAPQYRPQWDNRWGVPRANRNQAYVRHYNDLLLVNTRNGKVLRVYRNHFRWR